MRIEDIPSEITVTQIPQMHPDLGNPVLHGRVMPGYIKIGEPVTITFKTLSTDAVRGGAVEELRKQVATIRAESEMQCKGIEERIQSLLSITHDK